MDLVGKGIYAYPSVTKSVEASHLRNNNYLHLNRAKSVTVEIDFQ